jgi:alginate O-acetyltransferase complex protein AlgI
MFRFNFEGKIQYLSIDRYVVELLILLGFFIVFEWISREKEHPFFGRFKDVRLLLILASIVLFGVYSNVSSFIYFQF